MGKEKRPEGDPWTGYNKGEFITTRSLSGPRKGYPEESTKNVMVNTTPGRRGRSGEKTNFLFLGLWKCGVDKGFKSAQQDANIGT